MVTQAVKQQPTWRGKLLARGTCVEEWERPKEKEKKDLLSARLLQDTFSQGRTTRH